MNKHAYLIVAHNEFNLLKKLIVLLDDPRNDIFVHIDKKAADFEINEFQNIATRSSLQFIQREKVTWGGHSQINVELALLEAAINGRYAYYHLLSGADLPIKNQDAIHAFFSDHSGMEFLFFDDEILNREKFYARVKYFHFLQEFIGHSGRRNPVFLLNNLLLSIQKFVRIDRIKDARPNIKKGTVWFSITHDLAAYVVAQEDEIRNRYRYTFCADEIFLHTLVWNSKFKNRVFGSSLRYIDWERGQPYTFRTEDFETLAASEALWARKFSEKVDANIVDRIYRFLKS